MWMGNPVLNYANYHMNLKANSLNPDASISESSYKLIECWWNWYDLTSTNICKHIQVMIVEFDLSSLHLIDIENAISS